MSGAASARRSALVLTFGVAVIFLGVLGLAVRAWAAAEGGPVYTLAALDARLARAPGAWLHRTVRVRALLGGECTVRTGLYTVGCASSSLALTDPDSTADTAPLLLSWGAPPPLLAFLRGLPVVGRAMPAPQILYSGVPAIYRVQLRVAACMATTAAPCYGAVLQDAHPPDETTDWIRIPGHS